MYFTFCVNRVNNSDTLVNYRNFKKSFSVCIGFIEVVMLCQTSTI